jgi:hypothetical protein
MNIKQFLNKVGDLIGEDKILQAVNELRQFLEHSDKIDELLVQSARYTDIMQRIRKGTIQHEDAEVTKNQIRYAVVDIMREVEMMVAQDELLKEANQTLHKIYSNDIDSTSNKIGVLNHGKMKIKSKHLAFGDIIKNVKQ